MKIKKRFINADNFALYYGAGEEEKLSHFDIAVVEPLGHNKNTLKIMQGFGTIVLAYVSVVEIHKWSQEYPLLGKKDFLHINGKPLKNTNYDTFLTDLRSERRMDILYHQVENLLTQQGYDGVFLDTAGDLELTCIPDAIGKQMINAFVRFLIQIRNIKKDFIIVQNSGLVQVCTYTYRFIDGICWENPQFVKPENISWSKTILYRLLNMKKETRLKTMLLLEEPETGNKKSVHLYSENLKEILSIADIHDYLVYIAPRGYTTIK